MRRSKGPTAVFLGLLFFLLSPTVDAQVVASLTAPSVIAEADGVSGILTAVEAVGPVALQGSVRLQAERIEGMVDVSRSDLVVSGTVVDPSSSEPENVSLLAVTSTHFEARPDAELFVLSQSAMASIDGSAEFAPQNLAVDHVSKASPSTPDIQLPVSGTVRAVPQGMLRVQGSFDLVLWSVNLTLDSSTGEAMIRTGFFAEPITPSPAGVQGAERTEERQAFLRVTNGTMDVTMPGVTVFSPEFGLAGKANVVLSEARGLVELAGSDRSLNGERMELSGDLDGRLSNSGGAVAVELEGTPESMSIGGVAVRVTKDTEETTAWLWGVFLAVAIYVAYRFGSRSMLMRIDRLMKEGSYERASGLAAKLKYAPRATEDAVVAQAVCLVQLGQTEQAKAVLKWPPWGRDRVRPQRLFLQARIAAMEGDLRQAADWLLGALALAPHLAVEAQADTVLGPLLRAQQAEGGYT